MSNDTIHITVRDDMSEELHLAAEEGMPKYVGAEASVSRIENGVTIRLKDYKGETEETVYEAIESIEFDNGIMTITLPDGREFVSEDLTGPQGPQGIQGPKGDTGEKGDKGDTGDKGDKGDKGDTGDKGDKGDKGDTGDKGDKGDKGDTGPQGSQGPKGDQGIQGETGPTGAAGADGEDGEDGFSPSASVSKVGAVATITITDKDGTTTATINDGSIADEADPIFTASPAYGITASDITAWDEKSDFSGDYDDLTNKPTIPSNLSDLTNDMAVSDFENDARYIKAYEKKSGSVVTVEDTIISDLVADINPVQDLHGYDKPWAGGNGKNKLPSEIDRLKSLNTSGTWSGNNYTHNGITFACTVADDGCVTKVVATGTASATAQLYYANRNKTDDTRFTVPTGDYTLSGCPADGGDGKYSIFYQCTRDGALYQFTQDSGSGSTASIYDTDVLQIILTLGRAYAIPSSGLTFYPMLRQANESSDYEPYSNICPISGWDEVKVWDDPVYGGNIAWNQLVRNGNFATTDGWTVFSGTVTKGVSNNIMTLAISSSNFSVAKYVNCPNGHIVLCKMEAKASAENKAKFNGFGGEIHTSWTTREVLVRNTSTAVLMGVYNGGLDSADVTVQVRNFELFDLTQAFGTEIANYIYSLERAHAGDGVAWFKNLFPKDYYAYNAGEETCVSKVNGNPYREYTIDLDGTRYGGTLDLTTGVLTVDMAEVDLGSLTWGYSNTQFYTGGVSPTPKTPSSASVKANAICSEYPVVARNSAINGTFCIAGNGNFVIYDGRYTSASDFKTAMSGVQLVYELAEPITVQLTPTEVSTLLGTNNVWADSGDVSVECNIISVLTTLLGRTAP